MPTRLRNETILSIKEIAVRIHLGASKSANVRLHSALQVPWRRSSQSGAITTPYHVMG
jgi:hypothetical protein